MMRNKEYYTPSKGASREERNLKYDRINEVIKKIVLSRQCNKPHEMRHTLRKYGIKEDIGLTCMWEMINDRVLNLTNEWTLEKGEYFNENNI
jgi:hypothetical protein